MSKHTPEAYKWSIENRSLIADSLHEALAAAFDAGRAAQNVGGDVGLVGLLARQPEEAGEAWIERLRQHFTEERREADRQWALRWADADRQP